MRQQMRRSLNEKPSMSLTDMKYLLGADTISKKNGVITIRKQFFYRFGMSEDKLRLRVLEKIPNAIIESVGEHFAQFRGGSSVANSSHWYVKFTIGEQN